jgi:hypothetical protein
MDAPLILNETLGDRNDHMGVLFVEATIRIAPVIEAERHLDFVTVIIGIIHSDGRENIHLKVADFSELFFDLLALIKELGRIGILLKATATASAADLATRFDPIGRRLAEVSDRAKKLAVPPIS